MSLAEICERSYLFPEDEEADMSVLADEAETSMREVQEDGEVHLHLHLHLREV